MKAQGEAFLGNTTVWGEKINKTVLWTFTRSGSGWIYLTIEKNVPQIYKMRACQQEKAHDLRYFHMLGRQADCCSSLGLSSFNSQLLHLQISLVSTQASSHAPLFHFFSREHCSQQSNSCCTWLVRRSNLSSRLWNPIVTSWNASWASPKMGGKGFDRSLCSFESITTFCCRVPTHFLLTRKVAIVWV